MGPFVVRANQTMETYSNSNPSYSINKIMYTIIGGRFQGIKKVKHLSTLEITVLTR